MNRELEATFAAQGEVVLCRQILRAGIRESELTNLRRRLTWTRPRRGMYTRGDSADRHVRLMAARLALGQRAVVSHESAAVLHRLPLFDTPAVAHLTLAPGGTCYRRYDGIVVYKASMPDTHCVDILGLRVSSPARALIDLARTRSPRRALIPMDAALHDEIVSAADLGAVLRDCTGWPGIRNARALTDFADARTESPLESLSRLMFAEQGLPAPTPQVVIVERDGWTVRADFLWDEYGVIGEADGLAKYTDATVLRAEKLREERLSDMGFEVVRFTWDNVLRRPAQTAERIRAAFARAAKLRASPRNH